MYRMLPDIENLLKLQDVDREIRRLQDEVAELPKRVAAIEQKLAGTKAGLEKAQNAVKADEASRRKYDTNIKDLREKISKYRDQSLAVKTNDQYKALMTEIQFAEKEITANEDKILELMVEADDLTAAVKKTEGSLTAEQKTVDAEKKATAAESVRLKAELDQLRAERRTLKGGNHCPLRLQPRLVRGFFMLPAAPSRADRRSASPGR